MSMFVTLLIVITDCMQIPDVVRSNHLNAKLCRFSQVQRCDCLPI